MTTPRITPQERSPRAELVAILEKDIAEVACLIAAQSGHSRLKHWNPRRRQRTQAGVVDEKAGRRIRLDVRVECDRCQRLGSNTMPSSFLFCSLCWSSIAVMTTSLLGRRELEVKYSAAEYRFLYSGLVDPGWSTRRNRFHKMFRVPPVGNVE